MCVQLLRAKATMDNKRENRVLRKRNEVKTKGV